MLLAPPNKFSVAIANTFCDACHSKTGPLTGGADVGKDFPMPVGSFVSSNLTPARRLSHWSDGEIFRAIRNGIDADGRWLTVMSYTNAGKLSDDDIQALIAYIRSQPAAGQETVNPPNQLNLLGVIMLGTGMLPGGKPVFAGVITAPPKGPTVQYGEYILSYQDCRECHGANLTGGVEGQLGPIGPDLNLVKEWKLEEFIATMRTGTDPSGHELSKQMPWRPIGKMDDEELVAVYQYLTHLPGS
jgi:cytochrome c553